MEESRLVWAPPGYEKVAEQIIAAAQWPRPIPIGERLPEEDHDYLVFFKKVWRIAYFDFQHRFYDEQELVGVTHWLPMPPKPE